MSIMTRLVGKRTGSDMAGTLLRTIEVGLQRAGMTPSRFGREVAGDPRLVFDLRNGRQPSPRTEARVRTYLQQIQSEIVQ